MTQIQWSSLLFLFKVQTLAVGDHFLYSGGVDLSIRQWSIKDRTLVKTVEVRRLKFDSPL